MSQRWPKKIKPALDKTSPATRDAEYSFPVFGDILSLTPVAPKNITLKRTLFFFALQLLEENSERDKSKYGSR